MNLINVAAMMALFGYSRKSLALTKLRSTLDEYRLYTDNVCDVQAPIYPWPHGQTLPLHMSSVVFEFIIGL